MADLRNTADEVEVPTLRPGIRLGKYAITRLLGTGGMGAVYEATHAEIGKRVAIKVLSPVVAAVPGARARFLREAQLTTRVRHPHIVDVSDMGTDDGHTYLVMELLAGQDLAQRIERGGPLPPDELADVMLPVCAAMAAAHQAGITHRDLKPPNIFLDTSAKRTHPKVLDFGISKLDDGAGLGAGPLTATGAMIGTPYYLAPEQVLDNKSAGPASDQYALGVIFYECLTGARPYDGDSLFAVFQGIVGGNPKPLHQIRPGIPPALEQIVLRAMKTDPKARFPSIESLGRALLPFASPRARLNWNDILNGSSTTARPPARTPATPPAPPTAPRAAHDAFVIQNKSRTWIAVVAALAAIAAAAWFTTRPAGSPEAPTRTPSTATAPPPPPAATAPPPPPATPPLPRPEPAKLEPIPPPVVEKPVHPKKARPAAKPAHVAKPPAAVRSSGGVPIVD
jgi:eukaryotic-like serine/threonine-protein kinase